MMQQRQCVILQGDVDWCRSSAKTLLAGFDPDNILVVPDKQAQSQLGKEFDVVIFDAQQQFSPNHLGIIIGTVKAGGVLILLLSAQPSSSLFLQRFNQIATDYKQHDCFHIVCQGEALPELSITTQTANINSTYQTDDQQQAVAAILKVVHGHRRRPLVLSADRGRGKSASLGIAAAQLINEGKQTILVTAPSLTIASTVFEHAARLLADATVSTGLISLQGAEIKFVAPDALIESDQKADLLLVDEAAAIPASILAPLLHKYSRIVFATTLHGYEGTGQGFAIRFQQILEQQTPDWQHCQMKTPIRWAENDMLEAFSFQSLLLDAMPVAEELVSDCQLEVCAFERIDRKQLIDDEQSLKELFGLMVLAHYRTRPSDLQMMLDRDNISVYVMRYQGHIVASAWLVNEGKLDDELAYAIYAGERRLKGHLLPQSLLAHAGITSAGSLHYQRVIRIAVHPAIQQRGIGNQLLQRLIEQAASMGSDMIGASFGASTDLLNFWTQSGFIPVRLGIHQDDISGCHSVMMLHNVSDSGQQVLDDAARRFQQHWAYLLRHNFRQLDPDLVITFSQLLSPHDLPLSLADISDIRAFALAQRGFDFTQVSLNCWLQQLVRQADFVQLSTQQQHLIVMSVLQQRDWTDIAQKLAFTGKAQAMTALREACALLINTLPDGK